MAFGCRRGYRGNTEIQPLFQFPADSSRRALWLRALRIEADYAITGSRSVCAKHFDASDIIWDRQDSNKWRKSTSQQCLRAKLSSTAVPRIFEGVPEYLTTEKPPERSTKTTTEARLDADNAATSIAQHNFLTDADLIENLDKLSSYLNSNEPAIPVGFTEIYNNNNNNNILLAIIVDEQERGPEFTASIKICADMSWSVVVRKRAVQKCHFSDIAIDKLTNFCQASLLVVLVLFCFVVFVFATILSTLFNVF